MKYEECRECLLNWWLGLTKEQKKALPISNNSINFRDLFSKTEISYYEIRRNLKEDIKNIDAELKELGVIPNVEEYRTRLHNWWNSLTDYQKKSVPISHNSIDLRDLFKEIKISYETLRQNYLKKEITVIEAELKELGFLLNNDQEVVETLMRNFISDCESNLDMLWDIELTSKIGRYSKNSAVDIDQYFEQFGLISVAYLAKKFNCKYHLSLIHI